MMCGLAFVTLQSRESNTLNEIGPLPVIVLRPPEDGNFVDVVMPSMLGAPAAKILLVL